jgi:predicted Na+-dependent transporter
MSGSSLSLLPILATTAVFLVMLAIGLGLALRETGWVWERPGLLARALVSVLVLVPLTGVAIARALSLPRWLEVGVALMAISPGAPVALRRSLGAGGHATFGPVLQMLIALAAVIVVPLWVVVLNPLYAGRASVSWIEVAQQVGIVQLLPMGLGIGVRLAVPRAAEWLRPRVARVGMVMLICVALVIVVMIAPAVVHGGFRLALASALITVCALAIGHALGGPDRETRVTVAVGSAARNPGLALLVAQLNPTSPEVSAAVMTHLLVSALTITPYVMRRVRIR